MKRAMLLFSLTLCFTVQAGDPPLLLAQNLPGRLPGTLPGQAQPKDSKAAPAATKVQPPQPPARKPPPLVPPSRMPPPEPPKAPVAAAGVAVAAKGIFERDPLPVVSAGTPRLAQAPGAGAQLAMQASQRVKHPDILQLNGIDEIRAATSLPQGARDLLVLHARTLESQDMDGYIVNRRLAQEWFSKQPKLPESVHEAAKDKGKKKKKGCSVHHISTGCVKNEVSQAVDDLTEAWRKAYRDTTAEVSRAWNKAQDCFADHPLAPLKVPVKFALVPEFPVSVQKGALKGNVTVGVPVAGDFVTQLKLFYIPCLPFAIRPNTLGAAGTLESGGTLKANLTLTGQFDHTFLVPPTGGMKIPIQVIPIIIAGVPVAEMDVSIYVEGNVKVDGQGKLAGEVKLQSTQKTGFEFECSGHGCSLRHDGKPTTPATAMESIKLDGKVHVKPAIYTALQLSFDWELLEARAGPQPFLLGELYGCAAASATQTSGGPSASTGSQSVVADLDWGLEIRAEALAAKKKVAHKSFKVDVSKNTSGKNAHLYFRDLAQSSGLVPVVTGAQQAVAGQPAAFSFTMPECYPYRDAQDNTLQYRVTWTGGAAGSAAAPGAPAQARKVAVGWPPGTSRGGAAGASGTCTFQGSQASCSGAPQADTAFSLTWPAKGDYVLTVAPVDDKHGHKFDASRARTVNVRVQ